MDSFSFLPQRCLCCGIPIPLGILCRVCQARYQPSQTPESGIGRCPTCGQVRLAEAGMCIDCSVQTWTFPSLDGLFGYHDPGGELLRLYKFGGHPSLASFWARSAASRLEPRGPLVPVPSHRRSLWRRGWDPVETLTLALGKEAHLPVWRVLKRLPSAQQKTLDRSHRLENAQKAFLLKDRNLQRFQEEPVVWLIDDVVTTGATVEACSRLLKQAGAHEVRVFCLGLH